MGTFLMCTIPMNTFLLYMIHDTYGRLLIVHDTRYHWATSRPVSCTLSFALEAPGSESKGFCASASNEHDIYVFMVRNIFPICSRRM
ncbi:hypothetical protein CEXT_637831 [Caerostris extrusa]|uniref:Secreted protein n=1 Tax=Caerostris extrusa TaxID=172846 RepID=A0AAV4V2T4_CAEEX|nr:hypothetical protein CEXT_637831 [Caerostris extrusa]